MRHPLTAVLATSLALSVAAPALAQSVGDEQYRDPFAGEEQPQDETGGGGTTPAPAPAPTSTPPTDPTTGEPIATVAGELPRTGAESAWLAAIGALLMAAGAGLWRTART